MKTKVFENGAWLVQVKINNNKLWGKILKLYKADKIEYFGFEEIISRK